MKFSHIFMILMILQATIMLYDGLFASPPEFCVGEDCAANYTQTAFNENSSILWDFAYNPTSWSGSGLFSILITLGLGVSAFIIVGMFVKTPTDTVFFAPLFGLALAAGFIPLYSLWNVIHRDVGIYGCSIGTSCLPADMLWVLTGGILAAFFVLSAIDWWRTGSSG